VEWLLPDLLPRGSLIALAGLPGAGKSVLSYTMAMGLATGTAVIGRQPDRCYRVCYFDDENGIHDRLEYQRWAAWGLGLDESHRAALEANLWVYSGALGTHAWPDAVADAIDAHDPAVLMFDTATPCFNIEDENDNAEASQTIRQLRTLMRSREPHISGWVLKHGKVRSEETEERDASYTLRGAKAWEGAVDGIIYHIRGRGRPNVDGLHVTKLVPGKTRAFGLRQRLIIQPAWVQTPQGKGLQLRCANTTT